MSKNTYDPNKIDKIRDEIKNPEANAIAKLESIYHIASALKFDGSDDLAELLERELYSGYGDIEVSKVPPYRKIPLNMSGRSFKYLFTDPLSKYSMYAGIDVLITPDNPIHAEELVYQVVSELEKCREMQSFFKFLYREGTKRQEDEHVQEAKPQRRDKVDFTGLNIKPIKLDGDKDGE